MSTVPSARAARLDVEALRREFPILQRQVHGNPLVYLDSAATAQKPRVVLDAIRDYYENTNANVHRGIHTLAEEATEAFEGARARVAKFAGAEAPECVAFTRGTTESINLVASAWGRANLNEGDEIVLTEMEHHSNLVPWQMIAAERGARLRFVPVTDEGQLDLETYAGLLTERTKLVACVHKSNVLGVVNPIRQMAEQAHAVGALFLADAAQSAPHMKLDMRELDVDFLAFSAHKMCGPTGIGVLVARRETFAAMPPYQGGGEMIRRVELERSTYNEIPHRFEAGTPDISGAVGFAAALDFLEGVGLDAIHEHEVELTRRALERLTALDFLDLYGPTDAPARAGVVTFNDKLVHPHDLGTLLDRKGVAVRAGHHCAQPLMKRLGVVATTRASFYLYNTLDEVDVFVDALIAAHEYFNGPRKR